GPAPGRHETVSDDHAPATRASAAPDPAVLRDWFDRHGRDLPWRRPATTAWQVLVSEVMLQQTPVVRVLPVWQEGITRWPDPGALAAEPAAAAVRAWGRLGYPRRALRLHDCATVLRDRFDGAVPADVETLLTLPGVGDYTARAVACFAYGAAVPVVDVNVRRVIARALHGAAQPGAATTPTDRADVAAALPADPQVAARYSAALMEYGALVCTARSPQCDSCVLPRCTWREAGFPAQEGPWRRPQRYEGTDRQARGALLAVVREADGAVSRAALDAAWTRDPGQRDRALHSLLTDGLLEQTDAGAFALPGEHGHRG